MLRSNFDAARAEVVFGRGNKQENKAAFDGLYTHKAEIESALGTALQWNRGDDIKSSKVFIQLNTLASRMRPIGSRWLISTLIGRRSSTM